MRIILVTQYGYCYYNSDRNGNIFPWSKKRQMCFPTEGKWSKVSRFYIRKQFFNMLGEVEDLIRISPGIAWKEAGRILEFFVFVSSLSLHVR